MSPTREVLYLDPMALISDKQNIRSDDGDLVGLAATIRQFGVLQPLGVRQQNGGYCVVYGNRRRQAAIIAQLPTVPCIEVDPSESDDDLLVRQILENVQRRQLSDIEQADAFARLRRAIQKRESNQTGRDTINCAPPSPVEAELDRRVAELVGLSPRTIQRYLGLRDLAPGVRDLLQDGALTVTQAQHLRQLADGDRQTELAQMAVDNGLSAAQVRTAATALANRPALSVEAAIKLAQRGDEPPLAAPPKSAEPPRLARPPQEIEPKDDADLWPEDALEDGEPDEFASPIATADGHRTFRIRTVDAFCDAVDRLSRSLLDGDLAKAARQEPPAKVRLGLASKQLASVERMLTSLLKDLRE